MSETFDYYVLDGREVADRPPPLPKDYELRVFEPRLWRLRMEKHGHLLVYFYWYLSCRRGFKIYYVTRGDDVVHWSHVLSKNLRFAFMDRHDMEIGPSWTHPNHRGKGIFPTVLRTIVASEPIRGRWYIFARRGNVASKRSIEKAGFQFIGSGRRMGVLRRYTMESSVSVSTSRV